MSDTCKLVRTTNETTALKTPDGWYKFTREVKTYWCTPHGSSHQNEAYEKRTFTAWANTGEKTSQPSVNWVPDGPRLTDDTPTPKPKPGNPKDEKKADSVKEMKPEAPKPTAI